MPSASLPQMRLRRSRARRLASSGWSLMPGVLMISQLKRCAVPFGIGVDTPNVALALGLYAIEKPVSASAFIVGHSKISPLSYGLPKSALPVVPATNLFGFRRLPVSRDAQKTAKSSSAKAVNDVVPIHIPLTLGVATLHSPATYKPKKR